MKKILFVCTGNTCRSPMAQEIFNSLARKEGLGLEAYSAGIAAFSGQEASKNSQLAMEELGLDIAGHRAKKVASLEEYDLVLTMSNSHKRALGSSPKVYGLKEYVVGLEEDVEDPFGGDLNVYRASRNELYDLIAGLIDILKEDL